MSPAPDSLVSTKLRPSQARAKLVARPRLIAKLERETGRKLTLISAPAGFGKTTLLVEWFRERADGEGSVAWASLDEGDNDPVRFLSYLVAALRRTIGEEFGEGVLAALRSPEPPQMEAVLGALINELAELPGEVAVVLDDYHVIYSEPVHGVFSFLLEHLPPNVHLVISSRIDPPLQLSRLRARNQMMEIDAAELSFTSEEAATFLNGVMGLDLSAEDVAALEERTEGWIAGLQLAALSMRDRKDIPGFLRAFSGSHRDVLDYLAEEVLERQPGQMREFLLQTSILDHLSGALCDALTGRSDGQEMLERLEKDNLFVVALDEERHWYRYHHLFADFLRTRLERESPERIKELHCRAAVWYEQNGLISEAVGHALAAEYHERAADLVEQVIGKMWFRGEVMTLLGWLEALPETAKRRRPRLLLEHATALMVVGRLNDVEPLLREAEHTAGGDSREDSVEHPVGTEDAHRRYLLGYVAAIRAWRTVRLGDPQGAIELARQALALLPEQDTRSRSIGAFSLAGAYQDAGDLAAASAVFAEIGERGLAAGHDYMALGAMAHQAELQMARGRLREAEVILRRALQLAAERGGASVHATGEVHIAMGQLSYEWNDLDSAAHQLKEGVKLARRINRFDILVDGYIALSRVQRSRGDVESALQAAREAERLAHRSGVGEEIVKAAVWKARLHLTLDDLAAAAFEQNRATSVSGGVAPSVRETERIGLARLLVARGEHDEALSLLYQLREAAEAAGKTGEAIEILALEAVALRAKGEKERAVSTLAQALALAEPEGYVRTFADEGPPMAAILSEVLDAQQRGRLAPDVPAYYLRKLLAALECDDSSATMPSGVQLHEPLSERELEVLALLAAGKSNRQIASELFVALSTVKTHVKNIYGKLDVRNRTQAVSRARELGLL
jgi:LuxR family transcriptional regulator, maltose regulon positive regulatory protein